MQRRPPGGDTVRGAERARARDSQELIGIGGEHVLRLPSLAVPAEPAPSADTALAAGAVQLFVARARAADPRFVLDDRTAPTVAAICRRLDGIPLALEMAAARVPLLGVEGLANRLDERFRVLTAGKRTALPRQRTLHATLDWSYGLLSPPERAVFRRLGVFAGPFTLAAAGAVAAGDERDGIDVIECLSGLCDKSLVVADPDDVEASYRLLETARAYAQERLADASETAIVTRRHAQHYRRGFEACFDDWTQLSDAAFRARYAPHLDNLRAAIAWSFGSDGDDETAIALVGSSAQLWLSLSLYAEAGAWVQRATGAPRAVDAAGAGGRPVAGGGALPRTTEPAGDHPRVTPGRGHLPRPRRPLRKAARCTRWAAPTRPRGTTRPSRCCSRRERCWKRTGRPRLVAMALGGPRCSTPPMAARTTPSGNCRPPWCSIAPRAPR